MMDHDKVLEMREQLSALADGELDDAALAQLLAAPTGQAEEELHASWRSYHLVGEVLRGGEQAAVHASSGFLERLQVRLAAEPPLQPQRPQVVAAAPLGPVQRRAEPANDASFRWKMVAGCASFAAVAVLAWNIAGVGGGSMPGTTAPQLAVMPPAAPTVASASPAAAEPTQQVQMPVLLADGEPQIMIRDARIDELLMAHREAGGAGALHMPKAAGFVRSASFAPAGR